MKEAAAYKLRVKLLGEYGEKLRKIDQRLYDYVEDLSLEGKKTDDPSVSNSLGRRDVHNVYELLAALKFLRILETYPFDLSLFSRARLLYEGRWTSDGRYIEGSGGLKMSGINGRRTYRLTPIQVYMLAGVYGPKHYVNTECLAGSRELLPSEIVGDDGYIWDLRRLVRRAVFFIPRKFCKTTMGAFFQTFGFMFEDYNYEGYCCANSMEQAKILYNMAYDMIHQLDPEEKRIRFTATEINWRRGQARAAKIIALSAGGKTKDGLFAQYCSSDEYGSAGYVKNHSDMASLVNVVEGSMGPRREPLTIHTTTAGNVTLGPFQVMLDGVKRSLDDELLSEIGK